MSCGDVWSEAWRNPAGSWQAGRSEFCGSWPVRNAIRYGSVLKTWDTGVAIVTAPFRKEPPTYIDWPNAGASAGLLVGGYLLRKAGFQVASKVVSGAGGASNLGDGVGSGMSGLILRDVLLLLVAAAVAGLAFVDLRLHWASGILIALAVLGTVALIIIAWGRWTISGIWVGITIVTGTCVPLLLVDDYRRNRKQPSYPSNPRLLTTTRIDMLGISLASLMLLLTIAAAAMETLSSHLGVAIVWDLMLGLVGITLFAAIARLPTRGRKHDR